MKKLRNGAKKGSPQGPQPGIYNFEMGNQQKTQKLVEVQPNTHIQTLQQNKKFIKRQANGHLKMPKRVN